MSKLPKFRTGDEIEIRSPDLCMHGTLFPGKVMGPALNRAKLVVEYKTLKSKNCTDTAAGVFLIEAVDRMRVRPKQPEEHGREFMLNDAVDAFYYGGWREGVIVQILEGVGRFAVLFRGSEEMHEIAGSNVRVHREWCNGSWDPPIDDDEKEDLLCTTIAIFKKRLRGEMFTTGELVEIRTDEEGLKGAWFAATIVKPVKKGKFLVEYKDLKNNEDTEFLKEVVNTTNIRPYPPELVVVDGYSINEKVDALYNDAWWEGKVCKVLNKARYKVYFKCTNDEMVFHYLHLRPHQDWIDNTWIAASND